MKKYLYHIVTLVLLSAGTVSAKAQTSIFFSVSAVDRDINNSPVASYITTIDTAASCLQVVSGLYAFYGVVGSRSFLLDCPSSPVIVKSEIKLFPNPAVNYTRIQSTVLLADNPTLQITFIDAAGRMVMQRTITNNQLFAGYSLYLGTVSSGNYFLRLEGATIKQVIPLIKVN